MTKTTAIKVQNAREMTNGKVIRLNTYEAIRRASDKVMPTIETLRRNNAIEESVIEWCYSDGDNENISFYNEYVGIKVL